jgi:hypothetical protein
MTTPTPSIAEKDYCAIEDTLQSTEKGRRFLRKYVELNRSLESRRLLRSISRLHRAALGAPGLNAEISRDLSSVLRSVSRRRQSAFQHNDPASRAAVLAHGLEEVEACLISLIESIEDRAFEALGNAPAGSPFDDMEELFPGSHSAKLFGELSSYFTGEPR